MTAIRHTTNRDTVAALDRACFPGDEPYPTTDARWWLALDAGKPLGFAGAKFWPPDRCVFLCRAGVIPEARGKGLQRRLIDVRLRWATSVKARGAYTYTTPDNLPSANSLIHCGFKLFEPSYAWAGSDVLYWWLAL